MRQKYKRKNIRRKRRKSSYDRGRCGNKEGQGIRSSKEGRCDREGTKTSKEERDKERSN